MHKLTKGTVKLITLKAISLVNFINSLSLHHDLAKIWEPHLEQRRRVSPRAPYRNISPEVFVFLCFDRAAECKICPLKRLKWDPLLGLLRPGTLSAEDFYPADCELNCSFGDVYSSVQNRGTNTLPCDAIVDL